MGIPVFCLGEFLRVVTHPRLFDPLFGITEACDALDRVLTSPSLTVLTPGDRFWPLLSRATNDAHAIGNLVFDAQIVALCREAGVSALLTEDRDFDRFPGLLHRPPLTPGTETRPRAIREAQVSARLHSAPAVYLKNEFPFRRLPERASFFPWLREQLKDAPPFFRDTKLGRDELRERRPDARLHARCQGSGYSDPVERDSRVYQRHGAELQEVTSGLRTSRG